MFTIHQFNIFTLFFFFTFFCFLFKAFRYSVEFSVVFDCLIDVKCATSDQGILLKINLSCWILETFRFLICRSYKMIWCVLSLIRSHAVRSSADTPCSVYSDILEELQKDLLWTSFIINDHQLRCFIHTRHLNMFWC